MDIRVRWFERKEDVVNLNAIMTNQDWSRVCGGSQDMTLHGQAPILRGLAVAADLTYTEMDWLDLLGLDGDRRSVTVRCRITGAVQHDGFVGVDLSMSRRELDEGMQTLRVDSEITHLAVVQMAHPLQ